MRRESSGSSPAEARRISLARTRSRPARWSGPRTVATMRATVDICGWTPESPGELREVRLRAQRVGRGLAGDALDGAVDDAVLQPACKDAHLGHHDQHVLAAGDVGARG